MSASDEVLAVWRYCLNKGTELLELMSNPTAPSVWNGDPTVTFQTYGYTFARVPESLPYNPQRGNAYNRLGISTEPDHWTIMKADHENSFRIGDKIYGYTGTWFKNHLNPQDGAIGTLSSWGLDIVLEGWRRQGLSVPELPDPMLKRWSDCTWLMWKHQCQAKNVSIRNIRYFFQEKITNNATTKILDIILAKRNLKMWSLRGYPGEDISTESDSDGTALLGSPSAYGAAYFLAQHQDSLGRKKIASIRFWKSGNHCDMLLCVYPA